MTTTTRAKVEKAVSNRAGLLQKPNRPSFNRELAAEMKRLTGQIWDPGYLSNLRTGTKYNKTLDEDGTLRKAIKNLAARGIAPSA